MGHLRELLAGDNMGVGVGGLVVVVGLGPRGSRWGQVSLNPLWEDRVDTWIVEGNLVDGPCWLGWS